MQPSGLPIVLHENLVILFTFYWQGKICRGLRLGEGLYGEVRSFSLSDRGQAYALSLKLSEQGERIVITISAQHYRVWLDLRSQQFATICAPDPTACAH